MIDRPPQRRRRAVAASVSVLAILLAGCFPWRRLEVSPSVDFAAHRVSGRIVIDRMADGHGGAVVPAGTFGSPRRILADDGAIVAAFWYPGRTVTVRRSTDPTSALVGDIAVESDGGAIHFTFNPVDGPQVTSTVFEKLGTIPSSLRYPAKTIFDARGTFRADLHDAHGASIGWLRAEIGPYQAAPRIYDADVPPRLDRALVAAAVAVLDQEVDRIESRPIDDPYSGVHS